MALQGLVTEPIDRMEDSVLRRFAAFLPVLSVFMIIPLSGCTAPVEIGPFPVTVPVKEGMLPLDLLPAKLMGLPVTHEEEVCNLPSEEDAEAMLREVAGLDLSDFLRLSRLELAETVLTATQGDFSFISAVTLRYVAAPVNGEEPGSVVIGTASQPGGFGSQIFLYPPDDVDFLDLIQLNDQRDPDTCPSLEVEVTLRSVPLEEVHYSVDVTLDAYAEAGLF